MKTGFLSAFFVSVALLIGPVAFAQSSPGLVTGQVPSADQWNSYFSSKQDYYSVNGITQSNGSGVQSAVTIGDGLSYAGGTLALDNTQIPLLNQNNTFTGYLMSAGIGANCTLASDERACVYSGQLSSPVNGGQALVVVQYDNGIINNLNHYGASIFEDYVPTSNPISPIDLSPDGVLGTIWFDGHNFCLGSSPCSNNYNITELTGVFGQGYAWPFSTGLGYTVDTMAGVVGASQLGNGGTMGEGTVNNMISLSADLHDDIYSGDPTTKGTIKDAIGLQITEGPCANSSYTGAGSCTDYGILFDTYYDDPTHSRNVSAPTGGSIASVGTMPITVRTGIAGLLGTGTLSATFTTGGDSFLASTSGTTPSTGNMGNTLTSTWSAVTLPNATVTNVGSLALSPGNWLLMMNIGFVPGTGSLTGITCQFGRTSGSSASTLGLGQIQASFGTNNQNISCGPIPFSTTTSTTLYANADTAFTGGTGPVVQGSFYAIRMP